jgi:site-specific DNA-methyltransferase (adenine-specific)
MKLYKGDCLEIMKEIENGSIDAVVCDLPYGTTQNKWDTIIPFDLLWNELNRIVKKNGAIVLFGAEPFSSALRMSNMKNYKYDWVWKKNLKTGFLNAKKMPLLNNELISVFYRKPPTYNPIMESRTTVKAGNKKHSTATNNYGDYSKTFNDNQTDFVYPSRVIENIKCVHNSSKDKVNHPTQKPVELCEYLVKTYTNDGETVLDMTMGSGSTGVACKNTNRNFIGIELNDEYYEIANKRIAM